MWSRLGGFQRPPEADIALCPNGPACTNNFPAHRAAFDHTTAEERAALAAKRHAEAVTAKLAAATARLAEQQAEVKAAKEQAAALKKSQQQDKPGSRKVNHKLPKKADLLAQQDKPASPSLQNGPTQSKQSPSSRADKSIPPLPVHIASSSIRPKPIKPMKFSQFPDADKRRAWAVERVVERGGWEKLQEQDLQNFFAVFAEPSSVHEGTLTAPSAAEMMQGLAAGHYRVLFLARGGIADSVKDCWRKLMNQCKPNHAELLLALLDPDSRGSITQHQFMINFHSVFKHWIQNVFGGCCLTSIQWPARLTEQGECSNLCSTSDRTSSTIWGFHEAKTFSQHQHRARLITVKELSGEGTLRTFRPRISERVTSFQVSSDGSLVLLGGDNSSLQLSSVMSGTVITMHVFPIPEGHQGRLFASLLLHPSRPRPRHSAEVLLKNQVVVVAAMNTSLFIWSPEQNAPTPSSLRFNFPADVTANVSSLCTFEAPDRFLVATGHTDGTVCMWDLQFDGCSAVCKWTKRVTGDQMNQTLLSKGQTSTVVDSDMAATDINLPTNSMAFAPGGEKLIALGGLRHTAMQREYHGCFVSVWGAKSGACLNLIRTNHATDDPPHYVGLAPDGEGLLIGGRSDAQIYTLSGAKCLRKVKLGNRCLFACLSGDATHLVTVCREFTEVVQVWNVSGLYFPELEIRRVLWFHLVSDVVSLVMDCLR